METFEKKYKEALLRADEAVQKGCLDKDMFDIIFPPEESEDERIRRELIEYLRGDLDDITTDDTDRWIAYLEKQKEQKPVWSEEDKRRIDAICELLENTSAIHPNYSHRKLIIWLKSLRPSWEPSEEAVEGLFQNTPFPTICLDDCKDYNFKDGDKVRIIIVKEDKK